MKCICTLEETKIMTLSVQEIKGVDMNPTSGVNPNTRLGIGWQLVHNAIL